MQEPANDSTGDKCRNIRTGSSPDDIAQAFLDNLYYAVGRIPALATRNDLYLALAHTVRDRLAARWVAQMQQFERTESKKSIRLVCYLSAEFLPGPHLGNNLINLGIYDAARQAMEQLGYSLDDLIEQETEPGLGNGGLGRLASCFMDSLAALVVPAFGYGIRYEFGIFDQEICDGWQVEITDKWLKLGNPWELPIPELSQEVKFGGHTERYHDEQGRLRVRWVPAGMVLGIPYDTPILGYGGMCNTLRLWKAEAVESFDFQDFNVGNYYAAVEAKMKSETITKVLYPNDEPEIGKKLRLVQEGPRDAEAELEIGMGSDKVRERPDHGQIASLGRAMKYLAVLLIPEERRFVRAQSKRLVQPQAYSHQRHRCRLLKMLSVTTADE